MVGNVLRFVNTGYKLLELDGRQVYRAAKRLSTPSAAGKMLLGVRDQRTKDHMPFSSASVRSSASTGVAGSVRSRWRLLTRWVLMCAHAVVVG
jgi:hypothetical protein